MRGVWWHTGRDAPGCHRAGARIALPYLLPELTQTATRAILQQAPGADATEEVITLTRGVTGRVFRRVSVQMIPRLLELKQRNQQSRVFRPAGNYRRPRACNCAGEGASSFQFIPSLPHQR
jgi:hypothetical protein